MPPPLKVPALPLKSGGLPPLEVRPPPLKLRLENCWLPLPELRPPPVNWRPLVKWLPAQARHPSRCQLTLLPPTSSARADPSLPRAAVRVGQSAKSRAFASYRQSASAAAEAIA
jgi:hypothetical protein